MFSYLFFKRLFDFLFSLFLILFLSPLLIFISLLIWNRLGSPILFFQQRSGYLGRPFRLMKFRSMTNDTDFEGVLLPDSERLTPFGSWLRRTSIDELPQIFNILVGDMSFIGPRPLLISYLPLYSDSQSRRLSVRPGITGLAQINGRNLSTWSERFHFDLQYVDTYCFSLDLMLFCLTRPFLLRRDGIYSNVGDFMPPVKGN